MYNIDTDLFFDDDVSCDERCPFCGEDFVFGSFSTVYGLDARVDRARGDCYAVVVPCCQQASEVIEVDGYESFYGVSPETAITMITGVEVLEVTCDGEGAIVARLRVVDPAVPVGEPDEHGRFRAQSPSGWRDEVFEVVTEHHRHHEAPTSHKFSVVVYNGLVRVGVAVVGRPVSRELEKQEPYTLEVTRVCTYGHPALRRNASSKLYAACGDRARALGYDKLVTYTLDEESGGSLVASGFVATRTSRGGSWSRDDRPREDKAPTSKKTRWERGLTRGARKKVAGSVSR